VLLTMQSPWQITERRGSNRRTSALYCNDLVTVRLAMPKKTKITDEDRKLFRDAVKSAPPRAPNEKDSESRVHEVALSTETLSELRIRGEDVISFSRSGIQQNTLRKLRKGQLDIQARLDLHGYRIDEAREVLARFLSDCLTQQVTHVSIVHGKGIRSGQDTPILKNHVDHWLRHTACVLAFSSCLPRDGGTGAVYVLLKRG